MTGPRGVRDRSPDLLAGALPESIAEAVVQLIAADPHPAGTVDALLIQQQQWLTPLTVERLYRPAAHVQRPAAELRPALTQIVSACLTGTVHDFERVVALRRWVAAVPRRFPAGSQTTAEGYWGDFAVLTCGGVEEAVIERGSPLAAELCRVLVTLLKIAGIPARLVFLYDIDLPARHCVVEVYTSGRWSVLDPVSDRAFVWPKHGFASAWEIRQMPALVDGLQDHARMRYVASNYYRVAAIATYDPFAADLDHREHLIDAATARRLRAGETS